MFTLTASQIERVLGHSEGPGVTSPPSQMSNVTEVELPASPMSTDESELLQSPLFTAVLSPIHSCPTEEEVVTGDVSDTETQGPSAR